MKRHRRNRRGFLYVAVVAVVIAVAAPSQSAQKIPLLYKFESGDEYVYEQQMSQKLAAQGMPLMGGSEIASTMRWMLLPMAASALALGAQTAVGSDAEALLSRSIEFHDPDGRWGRDAVRLAWKGTGPGGEERNAF